MTLDALETHVKFETKNKWKFQVIQMEREKNGFVFSFNVKIMVDDYYERGVLLQ